MSGRSGSVAEVEGFAVAIALAVVMPCVTAGGGG